MSRYTLRLTGSDWRKASPGDAQACLLAQGLNRELGGQWTVAGQHATEFAKDGETIKRQLRLGSDARSVMRWFDFLGLKTGSTVTLYGNVSQPKGAGKRKSKGRASPAHKPHVPYSIGQKAAIGTAGAGSVAIVTGFWWVDAIFAGVTALGAGGTIAVRRGWVKMPEHAPRASKRTSEPLPSFRQLRTMQPAQRTAVYQRAVAAPEPLRTVPEPVTQPAAPMAPPAAPRPSWPVPAPRVVDPVSTAPAIPDYVPAELSEPVRERGQAVGNG
jgi:hypothetical protein